MNELSLTNLNNTQTIALAAVAISLIFLVAAGKIEITDEYNEKSKTHTFKLAPVNQVIVTE